MANSKHRKNHKQKLQQRKTKIAQSKNAYKNYMKKQIDLIQEQMAKNQSTHVNVTNPDIAAPTTSVNSNVNVPNIMLAAELNRLEQAHDSIK